MDELLRAVREEQWWGTFTDERTELTLEPLRWIKRRMRTKQPYRTVLLEQVPQALPIWELYADVLRKDGYHVWVGKLDSSFYQTPQDRKRAILIASLDTDVSEPGQTSWQKTSWGGALGYGKDYWMESNYSAGKGKGEDGKWILGTREYNRPSFTVTGKPHKLVTSGIVRRLNPVEMGMLQGFPKDHPWQGSLTEQYQQAGNAIPVLLAEAILRSVM